MLDNVLGVAVEQTFGVGLSYDFNHFDCSVDDEEVSIHQLACEWQRAQCGVRGNWMVP